MKKKFKYFLMGAGTVVAGFFAYAWLKDQPKTRPADDISGEPSADTIPPGASAEQNISQYIEHRRELYRKRAAQRAASPAVAEDSPAPPAASHEDPPQEAQRAPVEKTDVPDGSAQAPNENIEPDPNDEMPADCHEDGSSTPAGTADEETSPDETDKADEADEDPNEDEGQEESDEYHRG